MTDEEKSPLAIWLDRMEEQAEWFEWAERIGNIAREGLEKQYRERFGEYGEDQLNMSSKNIATINGVTITADSTGIVLEIDKVGLFIPARDVGTVQTIMNALLEEAIRAKESEGFGGKTICTDYTPAHVRQDA